MNEALAWVGQIFEWLGRWIPRWEILDTTEGAIKYVGGKNPKYCPPGIHWYWPVTTTFHTYPIVRAADRLQTQTIITADDKTVIVGGMIVYTVIDLLALMTTTHEPQTAIKDLTLTAIHDVCCQMNWEDLKAEQRKGTLDTKLRNAAQRTLKDYGVNAVKVMLIDLAPAKVYKLMMSNSMEEN
jgi:regulator of protease activity HflC (stomatin/prohibitin superfamily)